ncbi:MAG: FG-GAP-like repeat-containing protein [Planctomycetota bacterium]|nr:FG-GAP-like repeat-containing protein [Planctomycetota bacterium]
MVLADFNGDNRLDIATADYYGAKVSVLLGNGDGTFQAKTDYTVGSNPYFLTAADLDGDGQADLAVANSNSNTVSVLLNKGDGTGTFRTQTTFSVGSNPTGIAAADFDGDGKQDLAVANNSSASVSVLRNTGSVPGTVSFTRSDYGVASGLRNLTVGDLNGDGRPEIVAVGDSGGTNVYVLTNSGTGTFGAAAGYASGGSGLYQAVFSDLDGDGKQDLVVANYGSSSISTFFNRGDGTLRAATLYGVPNNPISVAVGDYNEDGRPDIVASLYANNTTGGNSVTVLTGNPTQPLAEDPAGSGLRSGYARGNLLGNGTDQDWYSFTAQAGDRLTVAAEVPGNPGSSGLYYYVFDAGGNQLAGFNSNSSGYGQVGPVALGEAGTYRVRVSTWQDYESEYRFRVTLAPAATMQMETENNDSTANASVPSLALVPVAGVTHQQATIAGAITTGDGGDFYKLGNLTAGTAITLTQAEPSTSPLSATLAVVNAAGSPVAASEFGSGLTYTVPAGGDGTYYARVVAPAAAATVSFWMNWNGANAVMPIGFSSYDLYFYGGNFCFNTATGGGDIFGISSAGLANAWHFVTAVFTHGDATQNQLWIDGARQTLTQRMGSSAGRGMLGSALRISGWVNDTNYRLTGSLDDVAVFARALTGAEIQAEYAARSSGTYSATVLSQLPAAYYRLGETGGTVAADASGHGNHGSFATGVTPGAAGALTGDTDTAYGFSGGQIAVTVPVIGGNPGLLSQYLLGVDLVDTVPPTITADTLPAEGSAVTAILDRFTLGFSEDLDPAIADLGKVLSYGGHAYVRTSGSTSFAAAEAEARAKGGHLVSINSAAENEFVRANFANPNSAVWIGLTDEVVEGTFAWTSGEPVSYTNWASGQPDNAGNEDYTEMYSAGTWYDLTAGNSLYGVIEFDGPDSDGDGLPDAGDPLPADPLSAIDLREAGVDTVFGTADDQVYHLINTPAYTSGLSASFHVTDGPLQPGSYRLTVGTSLTDKAGNHVVQAYVRTFSTVGVAPFVLESRSHDTATTATTTLSPSLSNAFDGSFTATGVTFPVGINPHRLVSGQLNGDGHLDVVTANHSSSTVSVLLGNGDGTFQGKVDYATGSGPTDVVLADFNGDNRLDIATADYYGAKVSVLLGNGDGTFQAKTDYTVGSVPYFLTAADLDGDGKQDLAVANYSSNTVSVLLNTGAGTGTFWSPTTFSVGSNPTGIAAADFDGDGKQDLVVANLSSAFVSVLRNTGSGPGTVSFTRSDVSVASSLRNVTAGDLNGDGRPEIVAVGDSEGTNVYVLTNSGTGTFAAAAGYASGGSGLYQVVFSDLDGDGKPDLVVANYGSSHVSTFYNRGDGTFRAATLYGVPNNSISVAVGDYNEDGRTDLVASLCANNSSGGNSVTILTGNPTQALAEDPAGSGLRSGYARGNLWGNGTDQDWYSFSARAGDLLTLAAEVPGNPANSGLYYYVFDAGGNALTGFNSNSSGYGQTGSVALAGPGTYRVRVTTWYDYESEYRLRVTLAPSATLQMESETNDSIGSANTVTLTSAAQGQLQAAITGAVTTGDGGDDYYLGNFAAGTAINLATRLPGTSPLVPKVEVLYNTGTPLVDNDGNPNDGTAQSVTTVAGAYYARVTAVSGAGLLAQYILDVAASSTTPPTITGTSLPSAGTTSTAVIDRFTVNFSADMLAAAVNSVGPGGAIELRSAGLDGVFGNGDDSVYALVSPGYVGGLSAVYRVADGPLQPGNYRLTISTGMRDRLGNPQAAPYVLAFTVAALPGYMIESRSNDTAVTATVLTMLEDPAGSTLKSAGARGNLGSSSDTDYFSFSGMAGDQVVLSVEQPYAGASNRLNYIISKPDGSQLTSFSPNSSTGRGQTAAITLSATGTYTVQVAWYETYTSEYRFRVLTATPGNVQLESETNDGTTNATVVTLATSNDTKFASVAGVASQGGDLDYFNLGTVNAGQTVFLTSRQPACSPIDPVVSLYNAQNGYVVESGSGRPFDGVAQVNITQTGTYYAVIRAGNNTGSLLSQYVTDIQIVATGSVNFPNLQVTAITLPGGAPLSGQSITFSYTVQNVGTQSTGVSGWADSGVLSLDPIYGNADDLPLGVFAHSGALNPGASYANNPTVVLPDGIAGDYYLLLFTDSGNAVNEYLLEGDNITPSSGTFHVTLAPYPDLKVENLAVSGPDAAGTFTASWNTANRGTGHMAANGVEHVTVQNLTTGGGPAINSDLSATGPLAVGSSVARSLNAAGLSPGHYQLTVTTDSQSQIYEFNATSHVDAEQNNTSQAAFDATRDLQVTGLTVTPPARQSGSPVTITWADTNAGNIATNGSWTDFVSVVNVTTGATLLNTSVTYNASSRGHVTANGSAVQAASFTLPDGDNGTGTIQVTVTTNLNNLLPEYNLAGNAAANNTSTTTFTSILAPYPDLQVTGLTVTGNPALQSGALLTIGWQEANGGNGATAGNWYDQVVVLNTATGETLLNTTVYYDAGANGAIGAGGSHARSTTYRLPDGPRGVGDLQVTVTADTNNNIFEHNAGGTAESNSSLQTTVASVLAVYPDLQVTGLTVAGNPALQSGALLTIGWQDVNSGNRATGGPWYDRVTVVNTVTGETVADTTVYYDAAASGNLAAGQSAARSTTYRLPEGPRGAGALQVMVTADTNNWVFEYNAGGTAESNNGSQTTATSVLAVYPDLQVTGLTVTGDPGLRSGALLTINWQDANRGERNTTGSWYDRMTVVNATTGETLTNTTVYYDAAVGVNIAAGQSAARSTTYRLPEGPRGAGALQVTVTADAYNSVFEYNTGGTAETNNAVQTTVASALAAYPDLAVTNVSGPAEVIAGQDVTVTWTVANQGNADTVRPWTEQIYFSSDRAVGNDVLLAEVGFTATIAMGAAAQHNQTFRIPGGLSGPYYFLVKANVTQFYDAHPENNWAAAEQVTQVRAPDLVVNGITAPAQGYAGTQVEINWEVRNTGTAEANGSWLDRVLLSKDDQLGNDIQLTSVAFNGSLAIGQTYAQTRRVVLPTTPGQYRVIVVSDALDTLAESSEQNNWSVAANPLLVAPPYRASVETDVEVAPNGTAVPLHGRAFSATDGSPAAQQPVTIRILVNGTRRVLNATTDANGNFTAVFQPLPFEAGYYSIGADYPGLQDDTIQDHFTLIGMQASPSSASLRLVPGITLTTQLSLQNLSNVPLSGLAATVLDGAGNVRGQATVPDALPGNGALPLDLSLLAADASTTRQLLRLHVTSQEGASLDVPLYVTVVPLVSQLTTNPGYLQGGMLRGQQTIVSFDVFNSGGAPSGDLQVLLPNYLWMSLAIDSTLPSLAPGQTTRVTLLLTPPADLPLQRYDGTLVLRGGDGSLPISFQFRATSSAVGDLQITVDDDYTFYVAGAPKVAGATVQLLDPYDNSLVVAAGTTDAAGGVLLPNVPEGSYLLVVTADKHGTYRATYNVLPATVNQTEVFIARETVTYRWTVVPTTITDQYDIKLEATFEANVPVPVVTIEAPQELPALEPGESAQIDVTLTNVGRIAAEGVALSLPQNDPDFVFTPLVPKIGTLPAMSAITVPVTVYRKVRTAGPAFGPSVSGPLAAASSDSGYPYREGCILWLGVLYNYVCGKDRVWHQVNTGIKVGINVCVAQAILETIPTNWGWWGSDGGDSSGPSDGTFSPPTVSSDSCDPTLNAKLIAIAKCVWSFVPILGNLHGYIDCGMSSWSCLSDLQHGLESGMDPQQAAETYSDCLSAFLDCTKAAVKETPLGKLYDLVKCVYDYYKASQPESQNAEGAYRAFNPASQDPVGFDPLDWSQMPAGLSPAEVIMWQRASRLAAILKVYDNYFGDQAWLEVQDTSALGDWLDAFSAAQESAGDQGRWVSPAERAQLLNLPPSAPLTSASINLLIDRWNRTLDYAHAGVFNLSDVPAGQSTDFIALDQRLVILNAAKNAVAASQAEGFEDPLQALADAHARVQEWLSGQTGVCAKVRIQINQQATMTRAAFLGTLEIDNGNQSASLQGIQVSLDIRDEQGNPANDRFAITGPELSGLTGVDGFGVVGPGGHGVAEYTFIPNREAAPDAPTVYRIGGTLRYRSPETGQEVIAPLLPSTITVYPDANLKLNYFLQRDVIGDDPFTPETEPSEPFTLGLIVSNTGHGAANNFTITSGQPKIVENQKGLLVDFLIVGAQVGDAPIQPSLTVDLGNIDPGQSQAARWLLTSTLQGRFVEYAASFEHVNGLGDRRLSLIDTVQIHELIHAVRADRPGDDKQLDFLVNDEPDPYALPDTLYLSDGSQAIVNVAVNPTVEHAISLGNLQTHLTADVTSGWDYLRLPDPGSGFRLSRVVRSDGKELAVGDNAWQTHYVFAEANQSYHREERLHLLDYDSTGSYTLYYVVDDTVPPRLTHIETVTPNPQTGPVSSLGVDFSEEVDAATLDYRDVVLTRNGGPNLVTSAVTITHLSGGTYRIGGLDSLTAEDGNYQVTVDAAGVQDLGGNAGTNSLSTSWAKGTVAPVVVSVGPVSPDVRNQSVSAIDVEFSTAIDDTSFGPEDLTLTRNGGGNLVDQNITITPLSDQEFRIGGLDSLTAAEGAYVLRITAAGIRDTGGRSGIGSNEARWTMDTTVPTLTGVEHLATNPRNTVVMKLDVSFSEPIDPATFDWHAVTLTRNGGSNLITSAVQIVPISTTAYSIREFNWVVGQEGTYSLSVDAAGIQDLAGNAGTGTASETWVMDTTAPAAPTGLAISPDRGVSATDGLTNTTRLLVSGTVLEPGLRIHVSDTTNGADLGIATSNATGFTLSVDLGTAGTHQLVIQAVDPAGNFATTAFLDVFVDLPVPALTRIAGVYPGERRYTPVDQLEIDFSEVLAAGSFGLDDLQLRRNGLDVPLNPATVTITPVTGTPTAFIISGLTGVTGELGQYELELGLAGVTDPAGNTGQGAANLTWTLAQRDTVPPTVVEVVVQDGQTQPLRVDKIEIRLSEPMSVAAMLADGSIGSSILLAALDSHNRVTEFISLNAEQFSYDQVTHTLTWLLNRFGGTQSLAPSRYELQLDVRRFTDLAGNPLVGNGGGTVSFGVPSFSAPLNLSSVGADIQVNAYSVPSLADFNGDGLDDLIVGEKAADGSGKIRVYLNTSSSTSPIYASASYVQLDGQDLAVPSSGCLGVFPRLVDWDGDGRKDLVVGLADGSLEFFRNVDTGHGVTLTQGRFIQAGDPGAKSNINVGARTTFDVVDWNDDGRADLVVGALDGQVRVYLNQANGGEPDLAAPLTIQAAASNLVVPSGRSSVAVYDLNGDGRKDVVVGNTEGQLLVYLNQGTDGALLFGGYEMLSAADSIIDLAGSARSRPFVKDVNGDGVPDVLLGGSDGLVRLYLGQRAANQTASFQVFPPPPAAPSQLAVTPDTGTSPTDGVTNTGLITLTGSLGDTDLLVHIYDLTRSTDLGDATVIGTNFSQPLHLTEGQHHVRVRAQNVGGYADSLFDLRVDLTSPVSAVAELPANETAAQFAVSWSGRDDGDGSGLASYDIYVSTDSGPYRLWLAATQQSSATFTGEFGHGYAFYSVATDNAGNHETKSTAAEATTTIGDLPTSAVLGTNRPGGSVYGEAISFTVTVRADDLRVGVPTGSVQWLLDAAEFGPPIMLSNGTCSFLTTEIPVGGHSLTVRYTSDSPNFADTTGSPLSQTVSPAGLTVTAYSLERTYGAANPVLSGNLAGLQNNDPITALFSTAATVASHVGTYTIVPMLNDPDGKLSNYTVTVVTGTLTVSPVQLTIQQASSQADPTNRSPIYFTAVFSTPVSHFTPEDLNLGGTAPGMLVATVTPVATDGTTYSVSVSGMTGRGTVSVSIAAGNVNMTLNTTDNTVTYTACPWQNPTDAYDVDGENGVEPLDVLIIINYINQHPGDTSLPPAASMPPPFLDVSGDNFVTPTDVLMVISYIDNGNVASAEGEGLVTAANHSAGLPSTVRVTAAVAAGASSELFVVPVPPSDSPFPTNRVWSPQADELLTLGRITASDAGPPSDVRNLLIPRTGDDRGRSPSKWPGGISAGTTRRAASDTILNVIDSRWAPLEDILPDLSEDVDRAWRTLPVR